MGGVGQGGEWVGAGEQVGFEQGGGGEGVHEVPDGAQAGGEELGEGFVEEGGRLAVSVEVGFVDGVLVGDYGVYEGY